MFSHLPRKTLPVEGAIQLDKRKKDELWAEACRRCRLSAEALAMAKEMGLNPLSLLKNVPSRQEPWKAPVEDWVRTMYAKRQEKAARRRLRPGEDGATSTSE